MSMSRWWIALSVLALAACGGSSGGGSPAVVAGLAVDGGGLADGGAGTVDGGASDGGAGADGGATDGGSLDGGPTDGGLLDGGPLDGGPVDGGPVDGGAPDGGGVALAPPISKDGWTFYGTGQGLSNDIWDVSADEGGNVYVAGWDALYAKARADQGFQKFDAVNAGLTKNCYQGVPYDGDPAFAASLNHTAHPTGPGPAVACPVISVAGAAPGTAIIGFKGHGTDEDQDALWAQFSGGADVVSFDGKNLLSRTRHVLIASPPHTVCADIPSGSTSPVERHADTCQNGEEFWELGRKKLRQVQRIAVNHESASMQYGDVWMGGTHATVAVLLANTGTRGWVDKSADSSKWYPQMQAYASTWADTKNVWEHDHPAFYSPATSMFYTGYAWGVAINPRDGTAWGSNGYRTGFMQGYGADLSNSNWYIGPGGLPFHWYAWWGDSTKVPEQVLNDDTQSLSFCDDGTLWIGSSTNGLLRRSADGKTLDYMAIPNSGTYGTGVLAVACDPADPTGNTAWVGLNWGGVMRVQNGKFTPFTANEPALGFPTFAGQPVRSIQIDRWVSPRIVYFAYWPSKDAAGAVTKGGGVASYSGP